MAAESAPDHVIGRERELATVDAFLDAAAGGTSALLIRGDEGMGKTTLWTEAVERARRRRRRVLVARPTPAETPLSFAGLIDLLDEVPDGQIARLPAPQRLALEAALLRREAPDPIEPGAIAVALVNLLRALAGSDPLVVAVDDVEWLDRATSRALEFALRRLRSEPVSVVTTHRPAGRWQEAIEAALGPARVRRIELAAMSMSALYQLVRARLGVALPRPQLIRLHEASRGNPLLGLELARFRLERGGAPAEGRAGAGTGTLSALHNDRLRRLPRGARAVLVVAAAMSDARVEDLRSAMPPGADIEGALEAAQRAAVASVVDGRVSFAHPLLASAVYDAAGAGERRDAHRRIAGAVADPDERARHLAAAADGPDEAVASALDRAAERARARGATDVATDLARQAVALTPPHDAAARCRRSLMAGDLALIAGDHDAARSLLDEAARQCPRPADRAEALLRLAELAVPLKRGIAICGEALDAAHGDPSLTSRAHRTLGAIEYFLGHVSAAEEHARVGVEHAERARDPSALGAALAELGHWTFCGGGGVRQDLFDRAVALDPSAGASSPRAHLAKVLMDGGRLDEARPQVADLIEESTRTGDLQAAALHLFHLAELEVWAGNWGRALELADESLSLRRHEEQPRAPLYVRAMSLALLGRLDAARDEARTGLAEAERNEDVVFVMQNLHVLGFADLSAGDLRSAHASLGRAVELLRPRWNHEFGDAHFVPDEIECLVGLGDRSAAEDLVAWMEEVGRRTDRPWTLATGARCRGLLLAARGDGDRALDALDAARVHHARLPMPFERARTLLVKGAVERRQKRRSAAAATLDEARGLFAELGAPCWVEKADTELARIGTRAQAQRTLTPVEAQIATLVAKGATNRDIAARLFLSPKTIEANLSRVYRKLDIRSRGELAAWQSRHGPPDRADRP